MAAEPWQAAGFGLYVHWPFCQSKCPYCDFNSHVAAAVDETAWRQALVSEVYRVGAELGRRPLTSIFFGGGTPSLMDAATVGAIVDAATEAFSPSNALETTLEANPSSVETGRFLGYRTAGVNRVSLGVQALDDTALRALGRLHTAAEARAALDIAMANFDRVSFDLIYARQHQSLSAWEAELAEALAVGTDHLSLYQLTIEPGTAFGERFARGRLRGLASDDLGAEMFEVTQAMTEAAGRPAYETSNHARSGAECMHNLIYWRSGDYAGIGPGAHGRITVGGQRVATEAARAPGAWLDAVRTRGSGEVLREGIPATEQLEERLMMGLRLVEGIGLDQLEGLDQDRVSQLRADGWIEPDKDRLRVTPAGRPLLNAVLRELLT
ncbi:MAG: radical SAM family heme chaperone HemW [Paracoccaceae bacterium]|nr:radical SAM family heme chaperone HemW [Paracoccaceae bacterium]